MVIGILCESTHDFNIFSILVSRSLSNIIKVEKFIPYPANGPIISKLDAASTAFFKKYLIDENKTNMAIFFSDLDGSEEKKKKINHWLIQHRQVYPDRLIVPVFARPHFEQWFFDEEDCLRAVFTDLPSDIPFKLLEAKERLKQIGNEYTDISVSDEEIKMQLAEKIDLNSLKIRNPDFKAFSNELLNAVRAVQDRG